MEKSRESRLLKVSSWADFFVCILCLYLAAAGIYFALAFSGLINALSSENALKNAVEAVKEYIALAVVFGVFFGYTAFCSYASTKYDKLKKEKKKEKAKVLVAIAAGEAVVAIGALVFAIIWSAGNESVKFFAPLITLALYLSAVLALAGATLKFSVARAVAKNQEDAEGISTGELSGQGVTGESSGESEQDFSFLLDQDEYDQQSGGQSGGKDDGAAD